MNRTSAMRSAAQPSSSNSSAFMRRCTGLGVWWRISRRKCALSSEERIAPLMHCSESDLERFVKRVRTDFLGVGVYRSDMRMDYPSGSRYSTLFVNDLTSSVRRLLYAGVVDETHCSAVLRCNQGTRCSCSF